MPEKLIKIAKPLLPARVVPIHKMIELKVDLKPVDEKPVKPAPLKEPEQYMRSKKHDFL